MKLKRNINIFAAVMGVVLGPSSLITANASQPPLTWESIGVILFGCFFGGMLVIGIQVLRKNPKYGKYALTFFEPISIFTLGSGIGAAIYSIYIGIFGPSSMLFLAVGVGLLISVVVLNVLYRAKFKTL